jgi:hypothetical protein
MLVVALMFVVVPNAPAAKNTASDLADANTVGDSTTDASGGRFGAAVSCQGHARVLTGGAYWHETGHGGNFEEADNAYLANSTVTKDPNGWYADGFHRFPIVSMDLTVLALCVKKRVVKGSKLVAKTVTVNDALKADAKAKCPHGMRVYTGGASFHAKGEPPVPEEGGNSRTSASAPLANGGGWYAAGSSGYGEKSKLSVYARCLAKKRFGPIDVVKETLTADDNENTGGTVACSGNKAPLTGGAYWRKPDKNLAHSVGSGSISSSVLTGLPFGWYATGQSFADDHRFTTVIRCVGGG